jgi:hypothetical protein
MHARTLVSAVLAGFLGLGQLPAAASTYQTIDPGSLQSFVGDWSPDDKPLCAALRSQADWDKIFHPAPVMGRNAPFSPPGLDWSKSGVLVVARVINAGDAKNVFHLTTVKSSPKAIELDYRFTPTPAASSTMKGYLAVIAPGPLASTIQFKENGKTVCRLDLSKGEWAAPAP